MVTVCDGSFQRKQPAASGQVSKWSELDPVFELDDVEDGFTSPKESRNEAVNSSLGVTNDWQEGRRVR
jgi:hypothetical protein